MHDLIIQTYVYKETNIHKGSWSWNVRMLASHMTQCFHKQPPIKKWFLSFVQQDNYHRPSYPQKAQKWAFPTQCSMGSTPLLLLLLLLTIIHHVTLLYDCFHPSLHTFHAMQVNSWHLERQYRPTQHSTFEYRLSEIFWFASIGGWTFSWRLCISIFVAHMSPLGHMGVKNLCLPRLFSPPKGRKKKHNISIAWGVLTMWSYKHFTT